MRKLNLVGKLFKPKDNPDFVPDRFTLKLPENVHGGRIIVFSANDVSEWLSPKSQELTHE